MEIEFAQGRLARRHSRFWELDSLLGNGVTWASCRICAGVRFCAGNHSVPGINKWFVHARHKPANLNPEMIQPLTMSITGQPLNAFSKKTSQVGPETLIKPEGHLAAMQSP